MTKLVARLVALVMTIGAVAPATAQLLPPLPGGSLIVTLTSPSQGANVSGTIPVSASVSIVGTLTVSRVEFFANGNFIGSDSGSPYSISWDTRNVGNGSYSLSAVAVDVLGVRWTSNSVTVNVSNGPPPDTSAPNVSITSPANGATVSGTINVTASASDNVGVTSVQFRLDGVNAGAPDTSAPYSIAWNTASSSNGAHSISAVARDAAGNTRTSTAVSVTVANGPPPDTTAPTVAITSPAAGATVSGTIKVSANASDNVGIAGVQFKLDDINNNLGAEERSAPYEISWDTTTVGNGQHTIAAVARDAAGNQTTSAPVTFTVANDRTSPTVTINQAAGQADPTSVSPIKFTVVFSESVNGFTADDVTISGTAGGIKTVTLTCGSNTYCVEVTGMTTGGTVIAAIAAGVATDAAGNPNIASTSTDKTVTWVPPDTTRPTVTINQAAGQGDPTNVSPILFTAVFSEPVSDFTAADVAIGGAAGATTAAVSGGPSTYTVALSGMTLNGTVSATIGAGVARDAAGNTNTASTSTDNSVTFNATPPAPSITLFDPTSGTPGTIVTITGSNFSGTSAVTFNAVSAAFLVDSATQIRAEVPGGATTGPINVTTPGGTATSTSFTVTTPAPSITLFDPTSGPAGTIVTITGTNFSGTSAVTFNAVSALFVVDSATQIRAEVPGGATTGPISVTTPGGTATSSSFTVTTPAVTRFEENTVNVTGAWGLVGAEVAAFSSGTARASSESDATAGFTFTGTAVTWIGYKCTVCGIASVSIDGGAPTFVDTAGPDAPGDGDGVVGQSEPVFTASALGPGSHTIVITVITGGAFIVVDALDVTGDGSAATTSAASAATRIEDADPAVSYIGSWVHLTDPRGTNGTAAIANVAGTVAALSFTGTEVHWIGFRYEGGGIARVSVDGTFMGEVDTYSLLPEQQTVVFRAAGLAPGAHTLTIEVTGTSGPAAIGSWVIIDAFDVTP